MEIHIEEMKGFVKKHNDIFILLLILSVSLLLKLLVIYKFNVPLADTGDAHNYDLIAKNLATGRGFVLEDGLPTAERAPAYCFFLAGVYFLFGHSLFAAKLAQVFLSEFTIILIYLIALRATDKRNAILATLFVAFYPKFILWNNQIMSETFGSFIATIFIFLFIKGVKEEKTIFFFLSGIFLGINALQKVFIIFYAVILLPIFLFGLKKQRRYCLIFL